MDFSWWKSKLWSILAKFQVLLAEIVILISPRRNPNFNFYQQNLKSYRILICTLTYNVTKIYLLKSYRKTRHSQHFCKSRSTTTHDTWKTIIIYIRTLKILQSMYEFGGLWTHQDNQAYMYSTYKYVHFQSSKC